MVTLHRAANALMAGYRKSGICDAVQRWRPTWRATGSLRAVFVFNTGSASLCFQAIERMPNARFAVPRHEGVRHTLYRRRLHKTNTSKQLTLDQQALSRRLDSQCQPPSLRCLALPVVPIQRHIHPLAGKQINQAPTGQIVGGLNVCLHAPA